VVIAEYDALVLPSLHDGWGVVVNEALLQGVPVIVSSNVGAKCMVESNGAGLVFESGDMASLERVLYEFCGSGSYREELSKGAVLVGSAITPEKGAKYMKDLFEYYYEGADERTKTLWEKRCDREG